MRSREERRFETGLMSVGVITGVLILSTVYAVLWCPQWRTPLGLFRVFVGSGALLWREMRPVFNHWRYLANNPEKPLDWEPRGRRAVMRIGAWLGSRHYLDEPLMPDPTTTFVLWRAAGFLAIAVGTLLQIIAAWPSGLCP
jgi:hypothetical protein